MTHRENRESQQYCCRMHATKARWPSTSRFLGQAALGSKRVGRCAPFLVFIPIAAEDRDLWGLNHGGCLSQCGVEPYICWKKN